PQQPETRSGLTRRFPQERAGPQVRQDLKVQPARPDPKVQSVRQGLKVQPVRRAPPDRLDSRGKARGITPHPMQSMMPCSTAAPVTSVSSPEPIINPIPVPCSGRCSPIKAPSAPQD